MLIYKRNICMLITLLFVASLFINLPAYANTNNEIIEKDLAMNIADEYLKYMGNKEAYWLNSSSGNATLFYLPDDKPGVYVADVIKDNKNIGHIVISATKDIVPVVSLSTQRISNLINDTTKKIKIKKSESIGTPKFIYGGPFLLAAEFPIMENGKKVKKVSYNLKLKSKLEKVKLPKMSKASKEKAKKSWENILTKNNDNPINEVKSINEFSTQGHGYKTLSVRSYNQWDLPKEREKQGCGPTSGANIFNYWDERGYSNLQSDSDRTTGLELINCLYNDMGTIFTGTSTHDWEVGMNNHATLKGDPDFDTAYVPWYDYYAVYEYDMVPEIDNGRPFSMLFYLGAEPYSWHYVTGIGYDTALRTYKVSNGTGGYEWHSIDASNYFDVIKVLP